MRRVNNIFLVTRFEHTVQCNKVNVEHLLQLGVKFRRSGDPLILHLMFHHFGTTMPRSSQWNPLTWNFTILFLIKCVQTPSINGLSTLLRVSHGLRPHGAPRLFQSILHDIPKSVTVVSSYLWKPGELAMNICSIFPMLDPSIINIAPFRGMPDFLFIGQKVAAVMIEDTVENFIIQNSYACVEIGLNKPSCTCADGIYLPDKVGELIANMYYYGSLLCLQKLKECDHAAEKVTFIAQGYYISKSTGTIILQLEVSEDGITVEIKSINYLQREIPRELWFLIKSIMD